MKKKVIAISVVTGIFIIGLCIKLIVGSRDVPVIENAAVEDSIVPDGINEQSGQEKTEAEEPGEIQPESEKSEEPEEIQPESKKPEEIESEETQAVQVPERQNRILHANPMEIYERFLNGKLSVEQEEKQVTISNLFWDNDIKYCFLDIDGDGIDELHIKDNMIYYAIKAVDGAPQILFKGWWYYEPVVTDELCGILYDANWGHGSEYIKFIQISPDGSTESDGEFRWSDKNENGNMDVEDSFKIDIDYDVSLRKNVSLEIDMEQYIQYKNEHSAQQAGYELEWTDRRLKEFSTWQEAYIDFLKKPSATIWVLGRDSEDYSLIYIDDDDTPELYFYTGGAVYGETIVSFYDGKVRSMNRDRGGIRYIEYGGLLYSDWGNMGFYPCDIYMLEKGEFSEIGTGWLKELWYYNDTFLGYAYYWEGKKVTEAEYEECIKEKIDKSKCIEPSVLYSRDEMLEILTNS